MKGIRFETLGVWALTYIVFCAAVITFFKTFMS